MNGLQRQDRGKWKYGVDLSGMLIAVLEYGWVLVVILDGNSVYHASATRNYYLLPLSIVMTVALLAANLLLNKIRIKKRNLSIAIGLCGYSMVYFLIMQNRMAAENFFYLFVMGLPCLFLLFVELYRKGRLIQLFYRIENVVCILAAISLFFWIFGTILGILKPNMIFRINWGNFEKIKGYWGLHFQIQRDTTFGSLIYRNSGIFAEAPMLNLWCDIALGVELLFREKPIKHNIVILIATIASAMSTTGIIFIVMSFGLRYLKNLRKHKAMGKILLVFAALIVVPMVGYALYELLVLKSETVSFAMRMSDYFGGLKMFWDYPIFGVGYGNLRKMLKYIYSPTGVLGFSNSVMAIPATGGFWMTLPFYYGHIGPMFPRLTNSKQVSMFCICLFYLFCTTAYFGRYLAVVMVAFGMAVMLESRHASKTNMGVI